jgi:hypothetical protein
VLLIVDDEEFEVMSQDFGANISHRVGEALFLPESC